MNFFLSGMAVFFVAIAMLLLTSRSAQACRNIFLISLITGCALCLMSAIEVLSRGTAADCRFNVRMPLGELYLGLDRLSAFFLLTIAVIFLLAGIYGYGYLKDYPKKNPGAHYAFYHLAFLALALVVAARNAVLFLIGWEMMTIASYFLITFYDAREDVRKAGYLYLIATHTGTFCLCVLFLMLGIHSGSLNFDDMAMTAFPLPSAGLFFLLGMIGFGVKAGFVPFHIWLPHAHPAAPSHISAVLSAVMIKMGIYGLMRIIFIIKDFPEWCPVVLLLTGIVSGIMGVLYALGQHEIKKLLAYHSIENIGIICLGMGIGLWGQIAGNDVVAVCGYAGALLHVFNHAVFKGLLFLSAGSVIRSTETGEIDQMGGLLKHLPWTGHLFLVGSLSICGLPLFNGFVSEWLVFRALFEGVLHLKITALLLSMLAILALALIGGLAAACFAKAFGVMFLGERRSAGAAGNECPFLMRAPMVVLAGICLWVGLCPVPMVSFAAGAAATMSASGGSSVTAGGIVVPLSAAVKVLLILVTVIVVLFVLKKIAMKSLPVERAATWGCGYSSPTSRMQYTSASFAEPVLRIFRNVLGYARRGGTLKGYFPKTEDVASRVEDVSETLIFRPLFEGIRSLSGRLKIIQNGYTQMYLFYIFLFLLLLLIWKIV